jgi:hypothetical protein
MRLLAAIGILAILAVIVAAVFFFAASIVWPRTSPIRDPSVGL